MKRSLLLNLICMNVIFFLMPGGLSSAPAAEKQPVYIYLYARVTDHVNLEISDDQLYRLLPRLERYRKEYPGAHISATILFSGAMSQALAKQNAQTGIVDYVLDFARRGVVDLGYDATDEPTYQRRPVANLAKAKTAEERWLARGEAAEKLLTEARDPLTGDPQPGVTGGLKEMQEVFGEAACIIGVTDELGGDTEVVQHASPYNTKAIMWGIPDPNSNRNIPGYGGGVRGFGREMSPIPESSPELFWQDGVLRSSETTGKGHVKAYEGLADLKEALEGLEGPQVQAFRPESAGDDDDDEDEGAGDAADRSTVRIIHVEIGSERNHLLPDYTKAPLYSPLKYAYDHPERPKLPLEARRDSAEVDAAYAKEDEVIKWLAQDYLPANPGSRFVLSTDLKQMTPPSTGFSLSLEDLRAGVAEMLKTWGNDTYPPSYLQAGGHYLSLADLFQVTTEALAELDRTGKLPQSLRVSKVYGPIEMVDDHGPTTGDVTVASLVRVCATMVDRLRDDTRTSIPKNSIPSRLTVDGVEVNAAQLLRLMAEALMNPSPETKLKVKMTYMFTSAGFARPRSRLLSDEGAIWTFKPAPLETQTLQSSR